MPPKATKEETKAEKAREAKRLAEDKAAIQKLVSELDAKFGEGTILSLSEKPSIEVDVISSGCLALDIALGIGGFPRGRITEIYGQESVGKTAFCEHAVREAAKLKLRSAYIDTEHALDLKHFVNLGIDPDLVFMSQPDTGEDALEITEALVRSGLFAVIVFDSVAAATPRSEIEGDMGDATMGKQARLMSQAMRKLSGAIKQSNTAVIFVNQLRQKIGAMSNENPYTTTGGMALKFYASVRLEVKKYQQIKVSDQIIGHMLKIKVTKNKLDIPYQECEAALMYGIGEPGGFSFEGDLISIGVETEVVTKRGAFFSYDETRLGQGIENSKAFLREHPEMAQEIKAKILAVIAASKKFIGPVSSAPADDDGEDPEADA